MLLKPAEERRESVEHLTTEAETLGSDRDKFVFGVISRQIGQHEFARELARRRSEVVDFTRILLLLFLYDLVGSLPLFTRCVVVIRNAQIPKVPKSINVFCVTGHRVDVASDDFIQIFKFFIVDPERLTETECILFAFLSHVDVLTYTITHFPSDRQMISTLAGRPNDDITLIHRSHQLLGFLERDVFERRVNDDSRRIALTELLLLALHFSTTQVLFGRRIVVGVFLRAPFAVFIHQI